MIMEDRPVDSKTREKEEANQNNDHRQQRDVALPGQAGNNKGPPQPPTSLEKKRKATENNGNHVSTMMSRNDNDDASSSRNSGRPDNYAAVATPSVTPRNTDKTVGHSNIRADKQQQQQVSTNRGSNYGRAIRVRSAGNFPEPGSTLGPFFCVGRLGKGTFCSIHKCLSLATPSSTKDGQATSSASPTPRLVAAKVELSDFVNSGVIEGESIMLEHLDKSLPPKTVPKYVGLYKSDEASAIVMELLPGEDMHYLREQAAAAAATATGSSTSAVAASSRRVSIADAVYLTAHVMLPLLREMHKAGVVHRDVKPSNCVRTRGRHFSLVDFGLSKSILVSKDSPHADTNHLWKPSSHSTTVTANSDNGNTNNNASDGPQQCLRKERDKADFRGTSMYASLRIHQGRDYSRRDDIWSLLYVFCDLISGGLPWMSHAAARDRDKCQELKEQICNHPEETARMLMGEDYHVSKYKRDLAIAKGTDDKNLPDLAQPLALSRDEKKVNLLKQAFQHVASLKYWDEPDYDLIQQCLLGFLEDPVDGDPIVKDISWETLDDVSAKSKKRQTPKWKEGVPKWEFEDSPDDIDPELWVEAEAERAKIQATSPPASMYGTSVDFSKLPVEWQYRIAQMNHTLENSGSTESHEVLNHFMQAALPLVYGTWDSRAYEFSQSNTANRGQYLREVHLRLINKCLNYAKKFNYFANRAWYYDTEGGSSSPDSAKRRKITWTMPGKNGKPTVSNSGMVAVSKVLFALEKARQAESRKAPAPL